MEIIPQAEVLDSLRLFAREVMPAFAEVEAGRGGRRADAVFGALELDDDRRAAAPRARPRRRGVDAARAPRSCSSPSRCRATRARCCPARCIRPSRPYATWLVTRYPESPVGPFALAQLRLMGRAGRASARLRPRRRREHARGRPRRLRDGWGLPAVAGHGDAQAPSRPGDGPVTRDGEPILDCGARRPRAHLGRRRPVHPLRDARAGVARAARRRRP